jgi:hypothetical protein
MIQTFEVEIDEYKDYEKSINALEEAYRCLTRNNVEDPVKAEEMVNKIKMKMQLIRKFVEAKKFNFDVLFFINT